MNIFIGNIRMIPPFIYQLLDHIYISDIRGFAVYDMFDIVIRTDNIKHSGDLIVKNLSEHTLFINTSVGDKDETDELVLRMKTYSDQSKKTLLYSNSLETSCSLYVSYLKSKYKFSNEDITHIFSSAKYPSVLIQTFLNQL